MERIIKFRGKSTGIWRYGYLTTDAYGKMFIEARKSDTLYTNQVIAETIGQFTGLFDKNGNEIYEGDIISKHAYNGEEYTLDGIVEYNVDGFCLKCIRSNKDACIGSYYAFSAGSNGVLYKGIIIGNIHDNPELLNK